MYIPSEIVGHFRAGKSPREAALLCGTTLSNMRQYYAALSGRSVETELPVPIALSDAFCSSSDLPRDWWDIRRFTEAGEGYKEQLDARAVKIAASEAKHYDRKYSGDHLPKLGPVAKRLPIYDAAAADNRRARFQARAMPLRPREVTLAEVLAAV